MKSSFPALPNNRCAVGVSKTEIVAPPIDWTEEKTTIPDMWNLCSAPREVTPIESPIAKCFLSAVLLSIVYLGEHYVVDALDGFLYVAVATILVEAFVRWRERRRATPATPSA